VNRQSFSDAGLVLLGHGSTQNAESSQPVFRHAAELRRRAIFAEVREAFWKQNPHVTQVLDSISASRVFIIPLFISEGYFCSELIPHELGFKAHASTIVREGKAIHYGKPIGTHESMSDVLLARARDIVEKFPFPRAPKPKDITLFIAGHGTARSQHSRKAIERQVEMLRAKNIYSAVHAVFMEESPRIADAYNLTQTRNMVVVPFFISDGLHTQEDIPVLLGEPERIVKERHATGQSTWRNPTEKHGKRLWYAPAIGTESHISDVILERVSELACL